MTAASVETRDAAVWLPWESRLAAAVPLPPLGAALALGLVLAGLHLGVQALLGFPHRLTGDLAAALPELTSGLRSGVVVAFLIAYTITAGRFAYHAAARDVRSLGRGGRGAPVDFAAFESGRVPVTRRVLVHGRVAGALGAAAAFGLLVSTTLRLPGFEPPWLLSGAFWASEWVGAWVYLPLLRWCVARAVFFQSHGVRDMAALGQAELPVDLIDPEPRHYFGRIALRNSRVWIVGLTLASLLFLETGLTLAEALVVLCVLGVGAATFLGPVLPVRRRVREAKAAELRRVDEELRVLRDRRAARASDPPGTLADRLAWRARIEAVGEWPFDPSTLARFGLYLLIPIASWIGGALVEVLIGKALE